MLTRPPTQSIDMASDLEALGATVIHFPTIQIAEPESWDALDAAIAGLEGYDWLVLTSANGAEYFLGRLKAKRADGLAAVSKVRTCVVGPATAKAVQEAGGRIDVTAKESRAEGVLAALVEYLGGEERLTGLRFLLPRAQIAREFLPNELARRGAHVEAVEAYRTIRPAIEPGNLERQFAEKRVDAVTFTSPSTVENFASLLGLADFSGVLTDAVVVSIGPVTTQAIRAHGLTDIVQPDTFSGPAMIAALVAALEREGGG